MLARQETIAVAESVTAGLLQFSFSNIPDAIQFFQGGLTCYNLAQKFKHLQVEPVHAQSVNCVSQKVADEMASGISKAFQSEWGIGVTGYATPVPESDHKLFAYFSIVYKGKVKAHGKLSLKKQDPPAVQLYYTNTILKKLSEAIR